MLAAGFLLLVSVPCDAEPGVLLSGPTHEFCGTFAGEPVSGTSDGLKLIGFEIQDGALSETFYLENRKLILLIDSAADGIVKTYYRNKKIIYRSETLPPGKERSSFELKESSSSPRGEDDAWEKAMQLLLALQPKTTGKACPGLMRASKLAIDALAQHAQRIKLTLEPKLHEEERIFSEFQKHAGKRIVKVEVKTCDLDHPEVHAITVSSLGDNTLITESFVVAQGDDGQIDRSYFLNTGELRIVIDNSAFCNSGDCPHFNLDETHDLFLSGKRFASRKEVATQPDGAKVPNQSTDELTFFSPSSEWDYRDRLLRAQRLTQIVAAPPKCLKNEDL